MKKSIIAAAFLCAFTASAETEYLKIELNDGTVSTVAVGDIKEMTFITEETSPAEELAGTYTGTNTVVVGGQFTYTAETSVVITANEDGTVNFTWQEYMLGGTVMGDLTLGTCTISNIAYDEDKGGFYRDYSNDGLTQHFKAEQGGAATMDKDYALGATSTIFIEKTDAGIKVSNPFKLGAMPFPITASYEGKK